MDGLRAVPTLPGKLLWILLVGGAVVRAQAPQPNNSASSIAAEQAFIKKYCTTCHSDKLPTAGLSLESVNLSDVTKSGEILEKVVRKLASGAMPPASAPKPDKAA